MWHRDKKRQFKHICKKSGDSLFFKTLLHLPLSLIFAKQTPEKMHETVFIGHDPCKY